MQSKSTDLISLAYQRKCTERHNEINDTQLIAKTKSIKIHRAQPSDHTRGLAPAYVARKTTGKGIFNYNAIFLQALTGTSSHLLSRWAWTLTIPVVKVSDFSGLGFVNGAFKYDCTLFKNASPFPTFTLMPHLPIYISLSPYILLSLPPTYILRFRTPIYILLSPSPTYIYLYPNLPPIHFYLICIFLVTSCVYKTFLCPRHSGICCGSWFYYWMHEWFNK